MPGPCKIKNAFIAGCLSFLFFSAHAQTLQDYLVRGDRYFERKDFKNALTNYLHALALDPGGAQTNFRIGVSCLKEENFRQAVEYLQKACDLNPEVDSNIDYHLGMACQEDQQYARALEHYKALKAKNKNLAAVATGKSEPGNFSPAGAGQGIRV